MAIPFLAVWNLATCSKHDEALYITQINQSWVLFKQQAFNATGEDRLWESKFYIPFQPQKWASNKSNSSVTSSCASCGRRPDGSVGMAFGLASADRLPVAVRIPAGPLGSLKCDPPKGNGRRPKKTKKKSCASCGFLRSRLESHSWNSFNSFPIVNGVPAGVPTPPDSGKTPQLKTSKLAQNCGKTEVLHLQLSHGICWSHEIETLPPM